MPKTAPQAPDHAAADDDVSRAGPPQADKAFPPLTISLETFVKDGSDHEFRELIFGLIGLHNQMEYHVNRFARHIGATNAQFHVVMALARTPDLTASQIAELMNVASPLVTIEIGGLVRKGIIERRSNESNRRSSFLNLTAKGKDLVRQVAPLLQRANDLQFRALTPERAAVLRESLQAMVADGRRLIEELESPDAGDATTPPATTSKP
jgi:MarR family transcriptional regulator, organic hydroperoxide resistance regulator